MRRAVPLAMTIPTAAGGLVESWLHVKPMTCDVMCLVVSGVTVHDAE